MITSQLTISLLYSIMLLGWPNGLIQSAVDNYDKVAYRFMIVDNSGSMSISDGMKLVEQNGKAKMIKCTRWEECIASVKFHAELAEIAQAPTEFRLLNAHAPIVVGASADEDGYAKKKLFSALESGPNGVTPLCKQVKEVAAKIRLMAPELKERGQVASVTIFSDGQASDGDLGRAMRDLLHLPLWVVIRLCTNDDEVGEYWDKIDNDIEVPMDVLDDFKGETGEVRKVNRWLNYSIHLHRIRENGAHIKCFDYLDERQLTPGELRPAMVAIFGGKLDDYPMPELDIDGFCKKVSTEMNRVKQIYDPIKNKYVDQCNINDLKKAAAGKKLG